MKIFEIDLFLQLHLKEKAAERSISNRDIPKNALTLSLLKDSNRYALYFTLFPRFIQLRTPLFEKTSEFSPSKITFQLLKSFAP